MKRHVMTTLVLVALAGTTSAHEPLTYSVKFGGQIKGEHVVERLDDGSFRYHLVFNDRGRGPDLTTQIRVDANGFPIQVHTTGVDYMKNPVNETFSVENGKARWKNTYESDSAPAGGFYISREGAETGVLLNALLRDDDQRLALLPAGDAWLEKVMTHVVESGGRKKELTLYAVHGLRFTPVYQWADAAGQLFYDDGLIRKGWESVTESLEEIQAQAEARHLGAVARRLAQTKGEPLLIVNARLFDPATRAVSDDVSVRVENGRIAAVGRELDVPENATRIDAGNRFLMPGLWDMHVHNFGGDVGLQHIAAGVTSVRDLAADTDALLAQRKRWHSGETLGPRVYMAGFIDGPGKYAGPSKVLVDTEAEARAAVRKYASLGYEQVKLYNSLRHELLPVIIEEAHDNGLRVSGHIPLHKLAEDAVVAGYDEIQHINHLFLNFLDRNIDNRTPARFLEPGKHGGELDLASKRVRDFVQLLVENKVVMDPTLAVFETMWVPRPGEPIPAIAPVFDRLPPMVARFSDAFGSGLPAAEGDAERYRNTFQRSLEFVKLLHDAGVPIVPGTDAMPGFTLQHELELYSKAGISNADVLYLATLGAAKVMGHADDTGSVAPGKRADFILLDGNPLRDMREIRNVEWIVRDGRLYRAADVEKALGMLPRKD